MGSLPEAPASHLPSPRYAPMPSREPASPYRGEKGGVRTDEPGRHKAASGIYGELHACMHDLSFFSFGVLRGEEPIHRSSTWLAVRTRRGHTEKRHFPVYGGGGRTRLRGRKDIVSLVILLRNIVYLSESRGGWRRNMLHDRPHGEA